MDPITQFLHDLELYSPTQAQIVMEVRQQYEEFEPTISEKIIYGGIGFFLNEKHIGGVYGNKDDVSIVFSRGNELSDPKALLLGKGKFRRHIKAVTSSDLAKNDVRFFIEQVINLES